MAKATKTQREFFLDIIDLATENGRQDIVDFASHKIDLLDSKASKKKLTKTQVENLDLKQNIYDVLVASDKAMTVSEILKGLKADVSSQKVSALLKQMIENEGRVDKIVEKKVSYFKALPMDVEETDTDVE
jgi:hypothetical protein